MGLARTVVRRRHHRRRAAHTDLRPGGRVVVIRQRPLAGRHPARLPERDPSLRPHGGAIVTAVATVASTSPRQHVLVRFVAIRLAWLVGTLFLVSILVFAATQALPGDPAQAILGLTATPERVATLRAQLGLDRPVIEQYTTWLGGIVQGDLGTSAVSDVSVWSIIGAKVGNSLLLMVVVTLFSVPISVGLALAAANRQGGFLDRAVNAISIVLAALPEFVVGITTVLLFATGLFQWFPAVSIVFDSSSVVASPKVMVLPALTLTLLVVPYLLRLVRASAIEVIESEYIRAAELRGVTGWRLLVRHAFPNVAPPMLQAIVLTTVYLVGGAVIVESVFSYPGMGLALVQAVKIRDIPTIQALVLIIAGLYLVLTAIADVLTTLLTPKMRTARR